MCRKFFRELVCWSTSAFGMLTGCFVQLREELLPEQQMEAGICVCYITGIHLKCRIEELILINDRPGKLCGLLPRRQVLKQSHLHPFLFYCFLTLLFAAHVVELHEGTECLGAAMN